MRYVVRDLEIRSENAAKPIEDAAAPLVRWLNERSHVNAALDYGCGKLRYTKYIAMKCKSLGIVDSHIQLNRIQQLDGQISSVKQYVKMEWPKCKIYEIEDFWNGDNRSYDFILCANVLSAIPSAKVRAKSLRAINKALSSDGELLVVNQHTNSYFSKMKSMPNVKNYLDGWITQSKGSASYFGILNKALVISLLKRYGFSIKDSWIEGQSNYVLATCR
jgi:2-polyprenyl-3-methyl-5-hydroxy-6-metoxy-1,4-benzoquinol methylase